MEHENTQPRFSAFLVLIFGVLFVFGVLSRLDRLVQILREAAPVSLNSPSLPTADREPGHVVAIIGDTSRTPRPADPPPATTRQESDRVPTPPPPTRHPTRATTPDAPSAPVRPPEATEPERVVVPPRPHKGKMVEGRRLADTRTPAPARRQDRTDPDSRVQITYQAGAHGSRPVGREIAPGPTYYTVAREDTLWAIAARVYGNGKYYHAILKANPGLRSDALPVGKTLVLPPRVSR